MEKDAPLVSVIMNCFNGEKYLREAIDSVYAQTYKNWEIIFWDNASTDNSAKIAKSYNQQLRYFCSKNTLPLGHARKLATEKAKGKYLAFLDCDDLWSVDKITKQVKVFEQGGHDLGVVYGGCELIYKDGERFKIFLDGDILPEGMVFKDLAKNNFIPFVSAMVDKQKFFDCGSFPVHLTFSTDYWMFAHLTYRHPVAALQEVCCKYRVHSENLSSVISNRITGLLESVEVLSFFLPEKSAKEGIKYYHTYLTLLFIKDRQFYQAISVLNNNNIWIFFIKYAIFRVFKLGS
jgi:glycosyltransferase involved in cell wall biosynthesis